MCGICGKLDTKPVAESDLRVMMEQIAHRGPDGDGTYVNGNVGLGHQRLSIIDLAGGGQPMSNEDGSVWIVFNGEIYNYQQLRSQLQRRGHRFQTDSDTETIVHLYEEHGEQCLRFLRGMFALAIWDQQRRRLFAARDRLGQKPFYYVQKNEGLVFASEIKALLRLDSSLRRMDRAALDEYLTLRLIEPPRSMFQHVRKLPPAHYLTFDPQQGLRVERYWDPVYEPKHTGRDADLLEELEHRLVECIRLHLVSDVPVGAFLSGGLDSTLIVALAAKHGLVDAMDTFSISLPYREFDEGPDARRVAERYGTRHHEQQVEPSLLTSLPRLVQQLDEPSDALGACVDLIARMARQRVKVVLGGDGGDELFGGYDRYYGNRYAGYYAALPNWLRRYVVQPALGLVPDGRWYKSSAHQLKWLHRLAFHQGGERYVRSLGYFYLRQSFKDALYGPRMRCVEDQFNPGAIMRGAFDRASATDAVDRMLYADCHARLPDHSVMILDRLTMAHGLEARSPFMDHEIAEFAARLPSRMKVRGRQLRYIQVQMARRHLPPQLLQRKKQGFSSALPYMLAGELDLLYGRFLGRSELARDEYFDQPAIDRLVAEHRGGKADHGNRLWLLLNSEVWYRMFIQGATEQQLADQIADAASVRAKPGAGQQRVASSE